MNELLHKYILSIKIEQFGENQFPLLCVSDRWYSGSETKSMFILKPNCLLSNQSYYCEIEYWRSWYKCLKGDEALREIKGYLKILNVQQQQSADFVSRFSIDVFSVGEDWNEERAKEKGHHINIDFCCKTDINIVCESLGE